MILKERRIPYKILQQEALLRTISKKCPLWPLIEADLNRRKAGYWGETQLDYYLRLISNDDNIILNDLRLPFQGGYFQIDSLILTKRYCFVIESKNIKGILFFDSIFDQLIRIQGDEEEAFEDPIAQAKTHILKLKFLLQKQFPSFPIDYLVSIANPKTILKSNTDRIDKVCHAYNIVHKINNLEKQYSEEVLTSGQLSEISSFLLNLHVPDKNSILKVNGLSKSDLLPGIFCLNCNKKMGYSRGKWTCSTCRLVRKDAYIGKTLDYFLLCGPEITKSEFKRFMGFPTNNIASHFLRKLKLPHTGERKARVYHGADWLENYLVDPQFYQKKGVPNEIPTLPR